MADLSAAFAALMPKYLTPGDVHIALISPSAQAKERA
jgi:hypothetical protein